MFNDGNLEELKRIPKKEIPHGLILELEKTLTDIENKINENKHNIDMKYSYQYFLEQKYKIESCILYLNKIK